MALADLQQGIDFYYKQQHSIGKRFEEAVSDTFSKIQNMPKAASFAYDNVRFKVLPNFPFLIIYEELDMIIAILRIFNTPQDTSRISMK